MAADAAGGGDVDDLRLAGGVEGAVGLQDEPGEPVDAVEGREVCRGARLGGVARRGVQRGCVVQVDEAVGGELRVHADALQAFLVVGVDVELAREPGGAGRVGDAQFAVAGGVQDRAVREDGERHGLADLRLALGEGDLLEVLGGGLSGSQLGDGCACLGSGEGEEAPASRKPVSSAAVLRQGRVVCGSRFCRSEWCGLSRARMPPAWGRSYG